MPTARSEDNSIEENSAKLQTIFKILSSGLRKVVEHKAETKLENAENKRTI